MVVKVNAFCRNAVCHSVICADNRAAKSICVYVCLGDELEIEVSSSNACCRF